MNEQSKKGVGVTAAIIVAALIVSAGVVFAASPYGLGAARTVTSTETTTTTVTPSSISLYKVTFNESGGCGESLYDDLWAVTMDNITIGQPSNVKLPLTFGGGGEAAGTFKMISTIVFTMPDGSYQYHITSDLGLSGANGLSNGTVTVKGSDVVVPVDGPYINCAG